VREEREGRERGRGEKRERGEKKERQERAREKGKVRARRGEKDIHTYRHIHATYLYTCILTNVHT
jgi:hypothetical protein